MDDLPTPPLQRHAALRPLSREHMGGLVQARQLLAAAEQDEPARRAAVAAFAACWEEEIGPHFDDEERLLLPLTHSPALRARLLDEHRALRPLAELCRRDPAAAARPEALRRLGRLLHEHIRWEEREFFEAVQRQSPGALDALTGEAAAIERSRPRSRARRRLDQPEFRGPAGA